jgi:hypothetical protein
VTQFVNGVQLLRTSACIALQHAHGRDPPVLLPAVIEEKPTWTDISPLLLGEAGKVGQNFAAEHEKAFAHVDGFGGCQLHCE